MLTSLDAAAVRLWCSAGLEALRRHQREIDDLNVYPVPDGDTGTNLVLTLAAAVEALAAEAPAVGSAADPSDGTGAPPAGAEDGAATGVAGAGAATGVRPAGPAATEVEVTRLGRVLRCMARGALLGARGSSGVILSQLLRGIADALAAHPEARGRELTLALQRAADAGYAAVAEPVEGTVLSVARAAAGAAAEVDSDDLVAVVTGAAEAAAQALARTPQQLPALARAGVVDAGGRGLVVLLDALVGVVTGVAPATAPLARVARDPSLLVVQRESGSAEYAYEVQYLLDAPESAVATLQAQLGRLGDTLVVVGTGDDPGPATWNVHVHVNDVGAALEAGVEAGRPHRISVTRFADQASGRGADEPAPPTATVLEPDARAVVTTARGDGLARLFAAEGAVVVPVAPTGTPSPAELLAAIRSTGAGHVVVLPNDGNALAVAAAAAEEARGDGRQVAVVPTRSPVQAFAALAVRDPGRRFGDDVIAMAEAAGATRWAEVTVAARDALTVVGPCAAGDVLGLVEGEVVLVRDAASGASVETVAHGLLERLLGGGGELVTLVLGADAPAGLDEALLALTRTCWPLVETAVVSGGQPHYPLLIGVE